MSGLQKVNCLLTTNLLGISLEMNCIAEMRCFNVIKLMKTRWIFYHSIYLSFFVSSYAKGFHHSNNWRKITFTMLSNVKHFRLTRTIHRVKIIKKSLDNNIKCVLNAVLLKSNTTSIFHFGKSINAFVSITFAWLHSILHFRSCNLQRWTNTNANVCVGWFLWVAKSLITLIT